MHGLDAAAHSVRDAHAASPPVPRPSSPPSLTSLLPPYGARYVLTGVHGLPRHEVDAPIATATPLAALLGGFLGSSCTGPLVDALGVSIVTTMLGGVLAAVTLLLACALWPYRQLTRLEVEELEYDDEYTDEEGDVSNYASPGYNYPSDLGASPPQLTAQSQLGSSAGPPARRELYKEDMKEE